METIGPKHQEESQQPNPYLVWKIEMDFVKIVIQRTKTVSRKFCFMGIRISDSRAWQAIKQIDNQLESLYRIKPSICKVAGLLGNWWQDYQWHKQLLLTPVWKSVPNACTYNCEQH